MAVMEVWLYLLRPCNVDFSFFLHKDLAFYRPVLLWPLNMECNTFLVLKTILRLTLATTFLCLFFKSIWKVVLNEKSFRITVEESDSYFPALNICPYYKEKSLIIKSKDNYTLKDLDKLPSLVDIIQIEIQVYKEGSDGP